MYLKENSMRSGLLFAILSLVVFMFCSSAQADSYLKQANYTGEATVMGQTQPAQHDTMEIWMAKERAAVLMQSSNMKVIVVPKEAQMYMINVKDKKYAVMPLSIGDAVAEAVGDEAGDSAADQMNAMMKGMMANMQITVTPTEVTKKIGDWNATKYDVAMKMAMIQLTSETWATKDISIDYSMYQACANALMAQMPGFEKMFEEMKKIEGVVVQQNGKMDMMGSQVETTNSLLEYAEKEAPSGMYDLDPSWKKVTMSDLGFGPGGM
jgi:hypothetical protein